jgi:hypothetical protein
MRRKVKIALIVPALCLVARIGAGSIQPEEPAAPADAAYATVNLGAFTFPVEQPRHVTYVVARLSARFADQGLAELNGDPENVVRLRDAVFDVILDARPEAATGDVDIDALTGQLERTLSARLPDLASVDLELLGTRNVPRH